MDTTKHFDFTAKARNTDPVTSFMAAKAVQPKLSYQRRFILRQLRMYQPCTAKYLDSRWKLPDWAYGIVHRRMKELETMGLVSRTDKGKNGEQLSELVCSLTEQGEEYLRDK